MRIFLSDVCSLGSWGSSCWSLECLLEVWIPNECLLGGELFFGLDDVLVGFGNATILKCLHFFAVILARRLLVFGFCIYFLLEKLRVRQLVLIVVVRRRCRSVAPLWAILEGLLRAGRGELDPLS